MTRKHLVPRRLYSYFLSCQVNLGLTPNIRPAAAGAGQVADVQAAAAPVPKNDKGVNEGALQYNPRCLTRDINLEWSKQTSRSDVEYLLTCPDAKCLEQRADGWEAQNSTSQNGRYVRRGIPQVHPAGHFSVGGLQNDPFASPGDPVFYLHHAQLDRVWAFWQAENPSKRTFEIGGTQTPFNSTTFSFFFFSLPIPPFSPPSSLSLSLSLFFLTPSITLSPFLRACFQVSLVSPARDSKTDAYPRNCRS